MKLELKRGLENRDMEKENEELKENSKNQIGKKEKGIPKGAISA